MKVAELILEYIRVLVYPVSLVVVFFALKDAIRYLLIKREFETKYGNASLKIGGSRNEVTDQDKILDRIKKYDGSLQLKELYSEADKLGKFAFEEKRRLDAAIEGLTQKGILDRAMEDILTYHNNH